MKCNGPFRNPAPLTSTEKASRAAVLKASREPSEPLIAALSAELDQAAEVLADATAQEGNNELMRGHHAAQILSDCWRDVAAAPADKKKIVFEEAAKKIANAVSGQWLSKTVMVDRLLDIAVAHARSA
jgi:hypothetical protein